MLDLSLIKLVRVLQDNEGTIDLEHLSKEPLMDYFKNLKDDVPHFMMVSLPRVNVDNFCFLEEPLRVR